MGRLFGVAVYLLGLIMMVTMVLDAMGIIDRTGPLLTVVFLVFGYLLCITGYLFARSTPEY